MDEGDFAGVAFAAELDFGGEQAADRDAVQAADEPPVAPAFHGVNEAHLEQPRVAGDHLVVDPCRFASGRRLGAAANHAGEVADRRNYVLAKIVAKLAEASK